MNTDIIIRLLQNSGFIIRGSDYNNILIEDPTCILRASQNFIEYSWIAISCITGLFLFGWAISFIMGAKLNVFDNIKSLVLILGILSAAPPIISGIFGVDIYAENCKTVAIPKSDINAVLEKRGTLQNDEIFGGEEFIIYDSQSDAGLGMELRKLTEQ